MKTKLQGSCPKYKADSTTSSNSTNAKKDSKSNDHSKNDVVAQKNGSKSSLKNPINFFTKKQENLENVRLNDVFQFQGSHYRLEKQVNAKQFLARNEISNQVVVLSSLELEEAGYRFSLVRPDDKHLAGSGSVPNDMFGSDYHGDYDLENATEVSPGAFTFNFEEADK